MRQSVLYAFAILVTVPFLIVPESAFAAMVVHSIERNISGSGTQLDEMHIASDLTGVFREDLINSGYVRDEDGKILGTVNATASQTTTVTDTEIFGFGRASAFGSGPARGAADNKLRVVFSVEEEVEMALSGELRITPHGLGLNESMGMIRLFNDSMTLLDVRMDDQNLPNEVGVVDFRGNRRLLVSLDPGTYTFEAMTHGGGDNGMTRCADFEFALSVVTTAIPEPGSSLLAMYGVLGIAGCRRLRRSRRLPAA